MSGGERLDEDLSRVACLMDLDCSRYSLCQLAHVCRCQVWGECTLVRVVGQPCHTNSQCAVGLVCRNGRCVPSSHLQLDDLPRFADLPEPDVGAPPDIPATYGGPLLVAAIGITLVLLCLFLAAWCRFTAPTPTPRIDVTSSSSVLINMNHVQPMPCYSSTQLFTQPQHSGDR